MDDGPDHSALVELLGAVRPGARGAEEPKGGARGGHRVADPGMAEAADQGSDSVRFGAAVFGAWLA